jgi:ATP/ADP translocase
VSVTGALSFGILVFFFFLCGMQFPLLCHIVLSVHSCTFPTMLITSLLCVFLDWRDEFMSCHACHVSYVTISLSLSLSRAITLLVELLSYIVRLAGRFIKIQKKKKKKKKEMSPSHGARATEKSVYFYCLSVCWVMVMVQILP